MKTQTRKLDFKKESIIELNENQLHYVNGGSNPSTTTLIPIGSVIVVSVVTSIILATVQK